MAAIVRITVLLGWCSSGQDTYPAVHAGILSGQFELAATSCRCGRRTRLPLTYRTFVCRANGQRKAPVGGGTYTGASLTPVIFRWNFLTHSQAVQPWFQGAGGLIYTTHKFPPDVLVPHGTPGGTAVWNFSPQGGIGVHYFTRAKQIDRSGRERRSHFVGVAGRSQSRRQCQHSDTGGIHILEVAGQHACNRIGSAQVER